MFMGSHKKTRCLVTPGVVLISWNAHCDRAKISAKCYKRNFFAIANSPDGWGWMRPRISGFRRISSAIVVDRKNDIWKLVSFKLFAKVLARQHWRTCNNTDIEVDDLTNRGFAKGSKLLAFLQSLLAALFICPTTTLQYHIRYWLVAHRKRRNRVRTAIADSPSRTT